MEFLIEMLCYVFVDVLGFTISEGGDWREIAGRLLLWLVSLVGTVLAIAFLAWLFIAP